MVVEDDPSLILGLRMNLERAGFTVREARDGPSGLAAFRKERPDLVLLDLMLPKLDGLEVLREVRQEDRLVPVIIVTALGSESDVVRGLELGANDYVTKPFSVAELIARVRASLRAVRVHRGDAREGGRVLRAGAIELHLDRREVFLDGEVVELKRREFDLLRFLMERPERVLTREQILANCWGDDYDGTDRTVDNFISNLRKKLKEDAEHPRHLRTVWGIGYRFVP